MVWLGTVFLIGFMAVAFVVSGGLAVEPMEKMLAAEVEAADGKAHRAEVPLAA
jgi:hypothetical protein